MKRALIHLDKAAAPFVKVMQVFSYFMLVVDFMVFLDFLARTR